MLPSFHMATTKAEKCRVTFQTRKLCSPPSSGHKPRGHKMDSLETTREQNIMRLPRNIFLRREIHNGRRGHLSPRTYVTTGALAGFSPG